MIPDLETSDVELKGARELDLDFGLVCRQTAHAAPVPAPARKVRLGVARSSFPLSIAARAFSRSIASAGIVAPLIPG